MYRFEFEDSFPDSISHQIVGSLVDDNWRPVFDAVINDIHGNIYAVRFVTSSRPPAYGISGNNGGILTIEVNPSMSRSFQNASTGSLITHELLHKSDLINERSASEAARFASEHPDAFDALVAIIGSRVDALAALSYGFEEPLIQEIVDNTRLLFDERSFRNGRYASLTEGVIGFLKANAGIIGISVNPSDPRFDLLEPVLEAALRQYSQRLTTEFLDNFSLHRADGFVGIWLSDDGELGLTSPNSNYSDSFLDEYGQIANGRAFVSLGAI